MKSLADRYKSLSEAYLKLADQFQQLDVTHMTLKQKVIPVIKSLKQHQVLTAQLKQDKVSLSQTVQALTEEKQVLQSTIETLQAKYEAFAELEGLLQSDSHDRLSEAEQQMVLVEETLQEMAIDQDPDLSDHDKQLLASIQTDTQTCRAIDVPEAVANPVIPRVTAPPTVVQRVTV
ncbi:hypothetical protein IQ266_07640 [filamentous cyanobacterium LEGE 11480]|uniref:Uncharacterized protein n=1 Tax=Romeriopsis navalis LEGE 11480 TaxID=2777977 RepID=A0A928Z3S7_9CYAN|nr:hypothetical protein [Romeriopsis navalis]MBE9029600.1 hypothetical protein [Romeriopsis navalis LEGE 11480]